MPDAPFKWPTWEEVLASATPAPANDDEQEYFNERSAVREYDGNLSRSEAEQLALSDLQAYRIRI